MDKERDKKMGQEELKIHHDYDDTGKIRAEYFMMNGKIERRYTSYDNGVLQNILIFKEGKIHGTCRFFDKDGSLLQLVQFKHGAMDGHMISYNDQKRSSYR